MEAALKDSMDFNNIIDDDLKNFLMKICSDYFGNIDNLIDEKTEFKSKIQAQIYSYVYLRLMGFSKCT